MSMMSIMKITIKKNKMALKMHNPPHPGEVLKGLYMEDRKLGVTETAKALGVTRQNLSAIINCHTGISPEMALRLSIAFGTNAEMWMNMQKIYDLWHVETKTKQLRKEVSVIG